MPRLSIRMVTVSGSRVIITNELTERDASEIKQAFAGLGIEAAVTDATPIDLKAVLKRRDRVRAKSIPKPLPSNVTKLPARKQKP